MTFAATTGLTRNNSYGRNQNNVEYLNRRLVLGPVSNFIVLSVLVCLLVVFYLSQVTRTNSYSYIINDYNQQQQALEEDYRALLIESAQLKSSGRVDAQLDELGLVQPGSVELIN